ALLANCRTIAHGGAPRLRSILERDAVAELAGARALFLSGAGTFNDLYITGVGGFWSVLATCMAQLGKPVVASGQQIGPLDRPARRMLARFALRSVDLLGTRDPRSLRC